MKKQLTFQDDKSDKFWTIETSGTSFTVTYGKTGTDGQSSTKDFDSEEKCLKEAEKLVNEKLKKGYVDRGKGGKGNLPKKTDNEPVSKAISLKNIEQWYESLDNGWKQVLKTKYNLKITKASEASKVLVADTFSIYEEDQIANLEPLRAFTKLREFACHKNITLKDLSPIIFLSGQLEGLKIFSPSLVDITLVGEFKKMKTLTLRSPGIRDSASISRLKKLEHLDIEGTSIQSIEALSEMSVQSFNAKGTKLLDLSPISTWSKLQKLEVGNTPVKDLARLAGLSKLEALDISDTSAESFEFLDSLNLRTLTANNTKLKSLSPLYKLQKLSGIHCNGTLVSFEEILRFRKSKHYKLRTVIDSDYTKSDQAFLEAIKKITFPLEELGETLSDWIIQKQNSSGLEVWDFDLEGEPITSTAKEQSNRKIAAAFLNLPLPSLVREKFVSLSKIKV